MCVCVCVCVWSPLTCQSGNGDPPSLIDLENLLKLNEFPDPGCRVTTLKVRVPSHGFEYTCCTFFINASHLQNFNVNPVLVQVQAVSETHCVYCRVTFAVICNMLEYNHSRVSLIRRKPLSSGVLFHLQTISFTLAMGTFCVPCSGSFHLKCFGVFLALLHCSPNELLGVSFFFFFLT